MHTVALLTLDKKIDFFTYNHNKLKEYFNDDFEFCGAIYDLNIVALTRKTQTSKKNFISETLPMNFDPTYGDILLIGSDEQGQACNIDPTELQEYFTRFVADFKQMYNVTSY
jgi:hypothetical protein